jgi:hypothetical protein
VVPEQDEPEIRQPQIDSVGELLDQVERRLGQQDEVE